MKRFQNFDYPDGAIRNSYNIQQEGMQFWRNQRNGFFVAVCHYSADPKKRENQDWWKRVTGNMRPDQVEREYEIDFSSKAGQKAFGYLVENPGRWQIPDIPLAHVPKNWRIIAGLDFGSTNPTSIHLYGIDQANNFYSIWEFFKPSNYREIARALKGEHPQFKHPLWRRVEKVMADPSIWKGDQHVNPDEFGGEEMMSLAGLLEHEGIYNLERATNNRLAGLERVKDALNFDAEDPERRPHLFFCKRCKEQWREMTNLVYDEIPPHLLDKKNQKEDVVGKDDHSYDELRYALMSVTAPAGDLPEPPPTEGSMAEIEKEMDAEYDEEGPDFF